MLVWWNEISRKCSSVLTFMVKLRHCRKRIKERRSLNFYNIFLELTKDFSEEIQKLDILEEHESLTSH